MSKKNKLIDKKNIVPKNEIPTLNKWERISRGDRVSNSDDSVKESDDLVKDFEQILLSNAKKELDKLDEICKDKMVAPLASEVLPTSAPPASSEMTWGSAKTPILPMPPASSEMTWGSKAWNNSVFFVSKSGIADTSSYKRDFINKFMKESEKIETMKSDTVESEIVPLSNENDIDFIRQSLVIERISERMHIVVIIIDSQEKPHINFIKCDGEPLGCYAYDATNDGYYVNCSSHVDLGSIPVAYRILSQGSVNNNNVIALPDEIIEKYFSPSQKRALKSLRDKYPSPRFSMQYMQSVTC